MPLKNDLIFAHIQKDAVTLLSEDKKDDHSIFYG